MTQDPENKADIAAPDPLRSGRGEKSGREQPVNNSERTNAQEQKASVKRGKFLDGDLMRHVVVMSLSASVGLLSMFVVDFVDLYFISLLGDPALTAAVGFAGTLLFFNMSVAVGLMIAMSALASRRIGRGEHEGARQIATSVIALGLMISTVFAVLFWIFTPFLLEMVGATGAAKEGAVRYLRIIVPAMPIMVLALISSGLLRAHGDAKRVMNATIATGFVNAVLDVVFIFGFGWGLEGAAWASVGSRFAMMLCSFIPVLRYHGGFAAFDRERFKRHLRPIFDVAGPVVLTNVATPIGTFMTLRAIADYGDSAVAGYSVISRLMPLAFCVVFALSGAVGPIIGQNFGAHAYERVRETTRKAMIFVGFYTLGIWLVLFLANGFIAHQFGLDEMARPILFWFVVVGAPLMFFNGVLFIGNAACNNLDRPFWSTCLNWGRNTIGIIPFIWLGGQIGGAPGVMIGQYMGSIMFSGLSLFLVNRLINGYESGAIVQKLDKPAIMGKAGLVKPAISKEIR